MKSIVTPLTNPMMMLMIKDEKHLSPLNHRKSAHAILLLEKNESKSRAKNRNYLDERVNRIFSEKRLLNKTSLDSMINDVKMDPSFDAKFHSQCQCYDGRK